MSAYEEELSCCMGGEIDPIMEIRGIAGTLLLMRIATSLSMVSIVTPTPRVDLYLLFDLLEEAVITIDLMMAPKALHLARRGENTLSAAL